MCQGFIPTLTSITAVSFQTDSKPGAGFGFAVWIDNADASFFPTGSVFTGIGGYTEIPSASLATGALTKYTLASTVTLVPGNRYVICFAPINTVTHAWAASYHDWRGGISNPYASGRRVHLDGSFANPSAPDSGNSDIAFETYGNSTASFIVLRG